MPGSIKIVFFGKEKSGKTSLLQKKHYGIDNISEVSPTIGVESFSCKREGINLQICDIAGHPKFKSLVKYYYKNTNIGVFCIDLSQPLDEDYIARILPEFRKASPESEIILVGTKSDLQRNITDVQLAELATRHGIAKHLITSAKNNEEISEVFDTLFEIGKKAIHAFHAMEQVLTRLPKESILYEHLKHLSEVMKDLPEETQKKIGKASSTLVYRLQDHFYPNKEQVIAEFQNECNEALHGSFAIRCVKNVAKAVASVAIAAAVTVIAAIVGFGIGFALGAWTGPGAFITGILGGGTAAALVLGGGIAGIGVGGFSTYQFFKPSQQDEAATEVANAAKEEARTEVANNGIYASI